MFNLSGSEIIIILILALVVLGPEKLPEAMRKAGRTWAELRKMSNSFQDEVRKGFDEPTREVRETARAVRSAATFQGNKQLPSAKWEKPETSKTSEEPESPDVAAAAATDGDPVSSSDQPTDPAS